jgi:rfaE bifunctional protein kinase chain/domain
LIRFDQKRLDEIIEHGRKQKIIVFGDLMVDQYLWGNVSRISPEAPVPVINIASEQIRFGGAANVSFNLMGLGLTPLLIGLVGEDRMGNNFFKMMEENNLPTNGIIRVKDRPTTVKTRIIGNDQHIARVDQELTSCISLEEQEKLFKIFLENIDGVKAILIQDYNKGVVAPQIIHHIMELAERHGKIVTVDPKFENFFEFKNVTLFKPNLTETEKALATQIKDDEDLISAGQQLIQRLQSEAILITRGAKGMVLFEKKGDYTFVETKARNIADVSGAGDTVIATLTFALCGGGSIREAVMLSNYAAGLVCEEVGVVPIKLPVLIHAVLNDQ